MLWEETFDFNKRHCGKNKRYGGKSIVMSCCGFPVWATLKVDIDSEHSVHKVFLIIYGSTTLLFSERTLNGWEQGPFMPKDFVKGGSTK